MIESGAHLALVTGRPEASPVVVEILRRLSDLRHPLVEGFLRHGAPLVGRRRDGGRERLVLRRRAARRRRRRRSSLDHGARMVDRDGERQPVATLVPGLDDADCGTVAIEERATAVAGIDRGVGLHERRAVDVAKAADDPAADGVLQETERRADGDHFLSDSRAGRRSHGDGRLISTRRVDFQHRDVVRRRRRLHASVRRRPVRASNRDAGVGSDDVNVREDRVGRHEKSAASPARGLHRHHRRHEPAHEVFELDGSLVLGRWCLVRPWSPVRPWSLVRP